MIDIAYYRLLSIIRLSINYVWHNSLCVLHLNMQSSLENMKTQRIRVIQKFETVLILFFVYSFSLFVFTEYNNTVR